MRIGPRIGPEIVRLARRSSGVLLRPRKSHNLSENLPSLESALDNETAVDNVGEVTVGEGMISNEDAMERRSCWFCLKASYLSYASSTYIVLSASSRGVGTEGSSLSLLFAGSVMTVNRPGTVGGGLCLRGVLGGGRRSSFLTMRPTASKTRWRSDALASLSTRRRSSVSWSSSSESSNDKYSESESSESLVSSAVSCGEFGPGLGATGAGSGVTSFGGFRSVGAVRPSRLGSERVHHLFEAYTGK